MPSLAAPSHELLNIFLLIQKNVILTIKNPKNLIFLVLAPFLLSGFLALFQKLADDTASKSWLDNPVNPVMVLPRCTGQDCISLSHMAIVSADVDDRNPPWMEHTISYIKRYAGKGVA